MNDMTQENPGLSDAYALRTPDDNRRLYAEWAATYDAGFAAAQDYLLPGHVARAFAAMGGAGPVLDVGAGTGLVAEFLRHADIGPIDGVDISSEMLALAQAKNVYRALVEADLTLKPPLPNAPYAGLVSAGTFTIGHLGPDAIPAILSYAAPGASVVFSVNQRHWDAENFASALSALDGMTTEPRLTVVPIYGPRATHEHRDDRAIIVQMVTN